MMPARSREEARSQAEPFDLVKVRESGSRASRDTSYSGWFDRRARSTWEELASLVSVPPPVVVREEGEMRPAAAGAIAGVIGACGMLVTASVLGHRAFATIIGALISHGALAGFGATMAGLGFALAVGAALGAVFAWCTRRLRVFPALIAMGLVMATATWLVVHAVAMPRLAPWLAEAFPVAPLTVAAAVFGVLVAMELPIRRMSAR